MQTTVQTSMAIGVPGMPANIATKTDLSYANYSKKLDKVTVSADDTTTTVTINGTAFTFTETGAAENKAYIADYLTTAINAGSEPVTAYYTSGNDWFYVESDVAGTTTTVVGTASCTVAAVIGNSSAIPFGVCVIQDIQDANRACLPIAAADITTVGKALGVVLMTQAIEQNYGSAGGSGYALGEAMSVRRKGFVYVQVEQAVVAGDQAYVRHVAGAGEQLGAFRKDTDGGSDAAALPTAYYRSNAAANGIALLEINLP
jgi:hypothetical protein